MVQSVELLLDAHSEDVIRAQWTALADAGLPSQSGHTDPSNRPHITIGVSSAISPTVEAILPNALPPSPFPVRVGSLLVFAGRRLVLARAVIASAELLALHRRVHEVIRDCPGVPSSLAPGYWTPHVTLALGLTPAQLGQAVSALIPMVDLAAEVAGVRRWNSDTRRDWLLRPTSITR